MQVHIILTNGAVIRMNAPEGFKLEDWIRAIRMDGHLRAGNFYVTKAAVSAFVIVDATTTIAPPMQGTLQ